MSSKFELMNNHGTAERERERERERESFHFGKATLRQSYHSKIPVDEVHEPPRKNFTTFLIILGTYPTVRLADVITLKETFCPVGFVFKQDLNLGFLYCIYVCICRHIFVYA